MVPTTTDSWVLLPSVSSSTPVVNVSSSLEPPLVNVSIIKVPTITSTSVMTTEAQEPLSLDSSTVPSPSVNTTTETPIIKPSTAASIKQNSTLSNITTDSKDQPVNMTDFTDGKKLIRPAFYFVFIFFNFCLFFASIF